MTYFEMLSQILLVGLSETTKVHSQSTWGLSSFSNRGSVEYETVLVTALGGRWGRKRFLAECY